MPRRQPRNQLIRRRRTREPYDRVLIVTEGVKSEPNYFEDLVRHYRLSSANVMIIGTGKDPSAVVQEAIDTRDRELELGERYDQVYCVFDRDRHANFFAASQRASSLGIRLARSWPCFEYWLLLHFRYIRMPFVASGSRSGCDNCTVQLRKFIPSYRKSTANLFSILLNKLDRAKEHAHKALADANSTGERNPSTEVHGLVEYLQEIRKPR